MATEDSTARPPLSRQSLSEDDECPKLFTFVRRTESAREREVFRFLRPWMDTFLDTLPPQLDFASPTERQALGSNDTALAAFAQLGTLRLNAQRCFVSLVSSSTEYLLAEATRSLSLQYDAAHANEDGLSLGTSMFDRNQAISHIAFEDWRRATNPREPPPSRNHYYTEARSPHYFLVSDVSCQPDYNDLPFIKASPWDPVRFLCAVPIRSAAGTLLGTYCIADNKPRYGASADDMSFLEDMANTIAKHLEAVATSTRQQRCEKLIQGIGLFNSGQNTLRDWWIAQDQQKSDRGRGTQEKTDATRASQKTRLDEALGSNNISADFERSSARSQSSQTSSSNAAGVRANADQPSNDSPEALEETSVVDFAAPENLHEHHDVNNKHDSARFVSNDEGTDSTSRTNGSERSDGSHSQASRITKKKTKNDVFNLDHETSQTYSRASNLIREALGAEGALFLDANLNHTFQSTSTAVDEAPTTSGTATSDNDGDSTEISANAANSKTCKVLGFSTRTNSSLKGFVPSKNHLSLTKSFQKRLMKRFPCGQIFNFTETGSTYSGSNEGTSSTESAGPSDSSTSRFQILRSRSAKYGAILRDVFPDVRSVICLPLWDASSQRFQALALVWVTTPLRHLYQDSDMLYLRAFSNSILANVSRLEAIAAEHVKSTFISTVTHELKSPVRKPKGHTQCVNLVGCLTLNELPSPTVFQSAQAFGEMRQSVVKHCPEWQLHGVLGGVEFLEDSNLSPFQRDMLRSIKMAGTTLLDTVNNILDFTKIENDTQAKTRHSKFGKERKSKSTLLNDERDLMDLGKLTEEVLETVVTAKRFEAMATSDGSASAGGSISTDPLSVSLIMQHRPHWWVRLAPGSWTRILTNVIGNSLKYTKKGFVRVHLDVQEPVEVTEEVERRLIVLTVEDTGIGMSSEFLQSRLYTPFQQEDSHANGTGLGLSIVKHLLSDINGRIWITSEGAGRGTKVQVNCLVDFLISPPSSKDTDDEIARASDAFSQQHLCMLTTNDDADDHVSILRRDVADYFRDGMDVTPSFVPFNETGSLGKFNAIIDRELIEQHKREPRSFRALTQAETRLIVLASSIYDDTNPRTKQIMGNMFTHITQPIGPRKLARAVLRSMQSRTFEADSSPPSRDYFSKSVTFADQNQAEPPKPERVERSASKYILLVEDNEINMKLLVALSKKLKLKYHCAQNGLVAVQQYKADPQSFYLILMDMSMPVMDGFRATEEIRSHERRNRLASCRIVALTGVTNEQARKNAFSSGVDEFMAKPISMKQVSAIVGDLTTE